MNTMPELSCYTTNLLAYLEPREPRVRERLAAGVRFAVATGPGGLIFSHHPRIDIDHRGHRLVYRSAAAWPDVRAALLTELAAHGSMLVCGDTYHLPWSPNYGSVQAPHWLLLHGDRAPAWRVADHFTALTPQGRQDTFSGELDDDALRTALTPMPGIAPEQENRDRHALGTPVTLPPSTHYRWLAYADDGPQPDDSAWEEDTVLALEFVATALDHDPSLLSRHVDDLWTAGRHFRYRLAAEVDAGHADPAAAQAVTDAWDQLPRALRFAAASADRGRPRAGVVRQAFDQLVTVLQTLKEHQS